MRKKINSQFAILQSLLLLCDVLTEGSVLSASGSGFQSRGSRMPTPHQPLSHPFSSFLHKHTFVTHFLTYKGVLTGTPEHCSVFLLYSMIFFFFQIHKRCCRHFLAFEQKKKKKEKEKMLIEYIK